jgi:leucyl-tRNA synthetase
MAPYLAHELWEMTGETSNLLKAPWPKYDPALAAEDEIEIPVQVNGKLRGLVVVPGAADEDQIKQAALADEKVQRGDYGQAGGESHCRTEEAGEYRGEVSHRVISPSGHLTI